MLVAVLSGFALSLTAPWLHRIGRGITGWIVALLPLTLTLYFASLAGPIAGGTPLVSSYPWVPTLGIDLAFRVDGLSLLFALLISGIGTLIMIYAGGYMGGYPLVGRFFLYLLMFMASMLGTVLSDNIFALFIFWELTSISSYLLIGFTHEKEDSRAAALQALLVTGGGGLLLMAGLLLLGAIGGSYEFSVLVGAADEIRTHPLYLPTLCLILLGAFTKSAQFPFHFWLPGAMAAPTPVSAYLHSATMVKLGIYLLARLSPILGGTEAWQGIVTVVGAVTMLVGGFLALTKRDLKLILAYSTISALGTLTLLLGLGSPVAVEAAIVFLLAHALYKGALFMVAGAIDHETGTRDVTRLGGLRRSMPILALVAGLAAISLAGFGPVFSFMGKELLLESVLEAEVGRPLLVGGVVLAGAFFVTAAALVGLRPFWGVPGNPPRPPHEAPFSLWLGPALLSLLGLLFGILPGPVAANLVTPSVASILGHTEPVKLYLWHGFNPALGLSLLSVLLGLTLYIGWGQLRRRFAHLGALLRYGPESGYRSLLAGTTRVAVVQTGLLQSGYLRYYLRFIIVTTIVLTGYTLISRVGLPAISQEIRFHFYELAIVVIILVAATTVLRADRLLLAIISMGVVGYGVALLYILYSAPDLAMTQFLIETLTVIVFVLVLKRLPEFSHLSTGRSRLLDGLIAVGAGTLMTTLMLTALNVPLTSRLTPYFAASSYPLAKGHNIVNVILVDFRGFDTLGEITVLSVAAVGIYALIKLRLHRASEEA